MKVIILAGGYGTRLGTISDLIPKPMIEIGGKPILWHIMKIYSFYGYNEFIICLGYKGKVIKDYFYNYNNYISDFTIDIIKRDVVYHDKISENWRITLADTGLNTLKGGRIKRIEKYLDSDINMLTYGDGVANIDIKKLIEFHKSHGKIVTLTGVTPPSMFGEIIENSGKVISFEEKPQTSNGLINGGYMVFNKELLGFLTPDQDCDFEFGPLENLAKEGQVMTYKHPGFWECGDTIRDVNNLTKLWNSGNAFWKVW